MAALSIVIIGGREVVVEVEPAIVPLPASTGPNAPEGAELTSFEARLKDATRIIKDTIAGVTDVVMQALEDAAPNECSVEIGLSFKGENQPIPVLVKVGGEASIKVTATWKKA